MWQLLQQHPTSFEFTESFLLTLANSLADGRFATFAFDSWAQRIDARQKRVREGIWNPPSVWVHLRSNWVSHRNHLYHPRAAVFPAHASEVLFVSVRPNVKLFFE